MITGIKRSGLKLKIVVSIAFILISSSFVEGQEEKTFKYSHNACEETA